MAKIIPFRNKISKPEPKPEVEVEPCGKVENFRIWCPELKWYLKDSCPFNFNRHECKLYKEMCGCAFNHLSPK